MSAGGSSCERVAGTSGLFSEGDRLVRLEDKVSIITGATKGIGRACACEFAREGAKVVVAGRTVALGHDVANQINADGGEALFVECDVSQRDQVEHLVQSTVDHFGGIDVIVNNAGVNHKADFFDITDEEWDWVMGVDLKGTFMLSQSAARVMAEQGKGGVIINMSSVMAELALADQVPYCAAKGGVNQLTRAMALALADKGIRVNAIGPGPILTELMKVVVHNETKHRELLSRVPLGRIGEPVEIARVAVFLASDDASFFTGQTIYPDGGRMIQGYPRDMEE